MRVIAVINLKGGVGKTTTTINMATMLAELYKSRVLIVDNDIQANVTRYFNLHDYDNLSIEHIYRSSFECLDIIQETSFKGVDIITSNLNLDEAIVSLQSKEEHSQITILRDALDAAKNCYDFCIIDCPPGIGLNVLNALNCAQDVIIPVKIDKNALDGMQDLFDVIEDMKQIDSRIESARCLVTMYQNIQEVIAGEEVLNNSQYPCFHSHIRYSDKVIGSTFAHGQGLLRYSPRSSACIDYRRFVREYTDTLQKQAWEEAFCHA